MREPAASLPGNAATGAGASDAELLTAIAAGSEPAFEELRARYGRAVCRVCRAARGTEQEDCEQEVFARIWRKAALFDPERGSAAAWLLTIARRTAARQKVASELAVQPDDWPVGDRLEEADVDAFWLEAALARLPERERRVIELAYYSDMSETTIAKQLGVPLGSVMKDPGFLGGSVARLCPGGRRCSGHGSPEEVPR
jgi:RNA polymerase sigma-70 factor (ECF subfamily)